MPPNLKQMFPPFFVRIDNVIYNIRPEDVSYFQMRENYLHIFFADNRKSLIVRSTLTDALSRMPEGLFIKTHRSFAVSIYYMDKIERYKLAVGKQPIPIAKNLYNKVLEQLNILSE